MIVIDGSTYDHNINVDDGVYEFEDGIKKVNMIEGLPYVFHKTLNKNIRFNCLHFQGHYRKPTMSQFVSFNNE